MSAAAVPDACRAGVRERVLPNGVVELIISLEDQPYGVVRGDVEVVAADGFDDGLIAALHDRLGAVPAVPDRLEVVCELLAARLNLDTLATGKVHAALRELRAEPELGMRTLAARLGVTHQHLVRIFRDGLQPVASGVEVPHAGRCHAHRVLSSAAASWRSPARGTGTAGQVNFVQDGRRGNDLPSRAMANLWVVPLAALVSFLVGGLYYAPPVLGRVWQRLCGLTDVDVKSSNELVVFGGSFVAALVGAVVLAFFLAPDAGAGFFALAGLLVGAGWISTGLLTTYLFERRPMALALVDGGYHTITTP